VSCIDFFIIELHKRV